MKEFFLLIGVVIGYYVKTFLTKKPKYKVGEFLWKVEYALHDNHLSYWYISKRGKVKYIHIEKDTILYFFEGDNGCYEDRLFNTKDKALKVCKRYNRKLKKENKFWQSNNPELTPL